METETFETPISKQKVTIKKWLTGKDRRELNLFLLSDLEMNFNPINPEEMSKLQEQKIPAKKLLEMQDKTIEIMVLDVDGSKEKILEKILNMREEDYNFVVEKVNKMTSLTAQKKS